MSFLFGGSPKKQSISFLPAPNLDAAAVTEDEKKKLRQGRGARSTLLTGPQGLLEAAPTERKRLLGE